MQVTYFNYDTESQEAAMRWAVRRQRMHTVFWCGNNLGSGKTEKDMGGG
jgi:hypothetical protein